MAQVVRFRPKIRILGPSDSQIKNGMVSPFKMSSTQASSSRTIDELDGDTRVYEATLLRARRAAGGRCVSPWPDHSRLERARA